MDDNKYFKWMWRFNGIAIFLATIAIGGILLTEIFYSLTSRKTAPAPVINLADDPEEKELWKLGEPEYIKGTDLLLLPLKSENDEIDESDFSRNSSQGVYGITDSYYSGSKIIKNILFLNSKTNDSYWMFEDSNVFIKSIEQYPRNYDSNQLSNTKVIFYRSVNKDTNSDGVINKQDKSGLAMSNPQGKNYKVVLDEYDRLISKDVINDDVLFLVYQLGDTGYSMQYDINMMQIISKNTLPKVGDSNVAN